MRQTGFFGDEPAPKPKRGDSHRIPEDTPLEVFRPKDGTAYVKPKKEPPKSVYEVPPKNMPPLVSAPTGPCCYCGAPAEGRYGAPASSTAIKSVLPLCNKCGPGSKPSLPEIWARLAEQVDAE